MENDQKRCQVYDWQWREKKKRWELVRCLWCEVTGWRCHVDRDLARGYARSPQREAECLKRHEEEVGVKQT